MTMPDLTPDEHAAEAERLIAPALSDIGWDTDPAIRLLRVVGHALLASRPTTPDKQAAGVGLLDTQAQNIRELRAENERLRELPSDLDPESLGLEQSEPAGFYGFSGCEEVWLGLRRDIALYAGRWHVYRKGNWTINVGSFQLALAIVADAQGEPVPSTGEDQSTKTQHAPDCLHDEPGVTICTCQPVPDEHRSQDDRMPVNCIHCGELVPFAQYAAHVRVCAPQPVPDEDQEELIRVIDASCLEGDCEDDPPEGEWCSHTRLVPASEVPEDVEMLPVPDEGSETDGE